MLKDLRHGFRVLMQAKGWTAVVVLSLAVGIGANAAIFSAVNALLLRKLPVDDPDSLVRIRWAGENDMVNDSSDYGYAGLVGRERSDRIAGQRARTTFSYPMFEHFRAANQTMIDLAGSVPRNGVTVTIDGHAETASALLVSGNYYRMLGVRAQIGRLPAIEDEAPSAPAVAALSDRYWRSRFAASSDVLGKTIRINNVPITIVGVVSSSFMGTQSVSGSPRDLSVPLTLEDRIGTDGPRLKDPTNWWVQVLGRLKPGVTYDQVRGNLEGVFQSQSRAGMEAHLAAMSAEDRSRSSNKNRTAVASLVVDSGSRGFYEVDEKQGRALQTLAAIVGLVLLLVCANVTNLLLSRTTSRQKEISVRLSIGATRGRVMRQFLTESLLLSAMGGGIGLLLTCWGQALLPPPVGTTNPPDWRVMTFTVAITAFAGIVFGIAPAVRSTSVEVGTALKENSRTMSGANALSRTLLVVQVAISLLLLVGAGLFLRTLDNLRRVDIGFDPQNLVFVRVDAEGSQFDDDRKLRYFGDGMNQLRALPGVKDATVSRPTLMSGGTWETGIYVEGQNSAPNHVHHMAVAPNFFDTMGIPVVLGRGFTDRDVRKAPQVAILNEAAARIVFPNQNPIGRKFGHSAESTGDIEVVGVLRDVRYNDLREEPPPTLYRPYQQSNLSDLVFSVRTAQDPTHVMNAVRAIAARIDPSVPVVTVETQMAQLQKRYEQETVIAQAYTLFGAVALFVAAIGLFGLMSYNVSRRTREIGIRMAMGARREAVLALVVREALVLVTIGILIGAAAALAAGRIMASQLFGVEPTDARNLMAAISVMVIVAGAAGYLPARLATRVDPMVALRYE